MKKILAIALTAVMALSLTTMIPNGKIEKEEEFEDLQKQVNKIIKQISKEILKGNIDIKPYKYNKTTGCDYCKYKTICMFDTSFNKNEYNYIKQETKEEILEKLKSK